jgi:uncharacterized membrane protein
MQQPVSRLRVVVTRIVLCLVGVIFLLVGIAAGAHGDMSVPVLTYAACGVAMGLVQIFLGIFGADTAVVRFLASMMESD